MNKKVQLYVPEKSDRRGRPSSFDKIRRVEVDVQLPETAERWVEDLILFDGLCMDDANKRQLIRLIPGLLRNYRFHVHEFAESGCLKCKRKKVRYASGGFCNKCYAHRRHRMRQWKQAADSERDLEGQFMQFLNNKYDVARALLSGDDSDFSPELRSRLRRVPLYLPGSPNGKQRLVASK